MKPPLQPGLLDPGSRPNSHPDPHLDPDQLSAFLEGALPEPQRRAALRHMSECAGCREAAFLAQTADPALERTDQPAGAIPRHWFAGSLGLRWTAALAGCVVGVVLFQLHPHSRRQPTPSVAAVRPAESPPQPQSAAPQAIVAAPKPLDRPAPLVAQRPKPAVAAKPQHSAVTQGLVANGLPLELPAQGSPSIAILPRVETRNGPLQLHGESAGVAANPVSSDSGGVTGRLGTAAPQARAQGSVAGAAADSNYVEAFNAAAAPLPSVAKAAPRVIEPTAQATSTPPLAAPSPVPTTQNVDVNATSITERNASTTEVETKPKKGQPDPLPSRLSSITSIAAEPRFHLELDTAGHLYWSRRGRHWKLVHPRWPGAIQTLSIDTAGILHLTTSTGAPWTSTDGRHWTPGPAQP